VSGDTGSGGGLGYPYRRKGGHRRVFTGGSVQLQRRGGTNGQAGLRGEVHASRTEGADQGGDQSSDKGGKEGQWSARKSQLLTQEYEQRGGGYKGEKDESQKNLEKWTEEEWQTKEGDTDARQDGETKRYLPKQAWENMSEEETEQKKRAGSKQG
jgi:hypothetical protein